MTEWKKCMCFGKNVFPALIKNSINLIPDVNFKHPKHVPVVKVFNDH